MIWYFLIDDTTLCCANTVTLCNTMLYVFHCFKMNYQWKRHQNNIWYITVLKAKLKMLRIASDIKDLQDNLTLYEQIVQDLKSPFLEIQNLSSADKTISKICRQCNLTEQHLQNMSTSVETYSLLEKQVFELQNNFSTVYQHMTIVFEALDRIMTTSGKGVEFFFLCFLFVWISDKSQTFHFWIHIIF